MNEKTACRIPLSEWEPGRVDVRAVQTAGTGSNSQLRMASRRAEGFAEGGLGTGESVGGGVSHLAGDSAEHRVGGAILRSEAVGQGQRGRTSGQAGGCVTDAGERVAGNRKWRPIILLTT